MSHTHSVKKKIKEEEEEGRLENMRSTKDLYINLIFTPFTH
jgi:hypothetical protein